ncbi:hypothetical protein GGF49_000723 [Coemansia sp. RSA 1853]|nr:hypothetical protein GGF49_000723 [Coemansia sp. RSA 1853]
MAESSSELTPKKRRPASLMKFFGKKHTDESVCEQQIPQPDAPNTALKRTPDSPLISFRNGRLGLTEKKLGLERHPAVVAAVFGFHQFIAQRKQEPNGLPLLHIPREHWPLVAMLVQERDSTVAALVRAVEQQLCPVLFGEESTSNANIIASGAVEEALALIADCVNYGVSLVDIQTYAADVDEVPHNLAIQRWEARDPQLLPHDVLEIVGKRRRLREDARNECALWFAALDNESRGQLLAGTLKKLKTKIAAPQQPDTARDSGPSDTLAKDAQSAAALRKKHMLRGQRSLQNFFATEKHAPSPLPQPADTRSYFAATFLPFNVRNDTELYLRRRPRTFDAERIGSLVGRRSSDTGAELPNVNDLLREFMASAVPARSASNAQSVASDGVDMDAAELQLMRLRRMPMKLLQFHGNRRPAYYGTCSRRAHRIGARRPFARDTSELDYEVDSDAEWEAEDVEGEELHSDDDDDDSSDGEFNSGDEDMDDINPDEEVGCGEMDVDEVIVIDDTISPVPRPKKPKTEKPKADNPKHRVPQRRKVIPLTPVVVGLVVDDIAAQSTCMDICSANPDQIPANDDVAAKIQILARLTVAPVSSDASLPLHISIDPADIWAKKPTDTSLAPIDPDNIEGAPVRKGKAITDTDLCALTNIVHGSSLGMLRLVEELKQVIPGASKAQIERLVHEHAKKEKRPDTSRSLWYVNADLVARLKEINLLDSSAVDTCTTAAKDPSISLMFEHVAKRQRTGNLECDTIVP